MKSCFLKLLVPLFIFLPFQGFSDSLSKSDSFSKIDVVTKNAFIDIEILKHILETRYAPLDWKMELFGWNLEREVQIAKLKILKCGYPSTKQCQKIIAEFMSSLRDYHVGVIFYSTEESRLPFVIKRSSSNRLYVTHVFSECPKDIEVGDEILSINHKSAKELINGFIKDQCSYTDISLGINKLTNRLGSLGDDIPLGNTVIGIKKPYGDSLNVTCTWIVKPELIFDFSKVNRKNNKKKLESKGNIFNREKEFCLEKRPYLSWIKVKMLPAFWKEVNSAIKTKSHSHSIGDKRGFIPQLSSNIIWEADSSLGFYSYICSMTDPDGNEKKVGFLRISSYLYDSSDIFDSLTSPWDSFGEIVNFLNDNTDLLVIDQQNNPGGSLFFMYGMVSMLIDQPVQLPLYRLILNQEDVDMAVMLENLLKQVVTDDDARDILGDSLEGLVVDKEFAFGLREFCLELIKSWESGEYQLTHPMPFFGFKQINPHPDYNYEKPILLLVNENSFSCADFLPAIFKDNQRAVILGMKTSGAGGFVYNCSFPNLTGIKSCSFTGSLAIREDQRVIENLGVSPDIYLDLSDLDLQSGLYIDFISSIKSNIFKLLN